MRPAPDLSIRQAAALAGRDRSVINRDLTRGRYPGARQLDSGEWRIPLEDLVAAGRWAPATPEVSGEAVQHAELQVALTSEREAHARTAARLAVVEALLEAERETKADLFTLLAQVASPADRANGAL